VQPEIELGPLTLQTFGICFALGFLAAGLVLSRRFRELGHSADLAYEMVFAALVGGLVGSRLYYVVDNWDEASDDLLDSLFSGSGLVWYGGAIGGALGVVVWAWRRFSADRALLDIAAVPLALGYAIGRVGCQLSGDGDYGKPWDGPWAMAYPDGTVPTDVPVHPTPIYETLTMGLVAWGLWQFRDVLRPGLLFACYLVAAGAERFLVEFLRRNDPSVAGLTVAQVESLVLAAAGFAWLAVAARGGGIRKMESGSATGIATQG
jgi:phosphatidylglycerol:prolipoprotein diacylglycerol transferase